MKIVCLGDSLTTGYNLAPGEGWVDLLNRETPHLWVNAGVAGDTSTGLLVRLQSQALPQKPDMVLFMGGGICQAVRICGHYARLVQCGLCVHGTAPCQARADDHLRGRLPMRLYHLRR